MSRILASTARCPYCSARLPKAPTREHPCPSCKNIFYIQRELDGALYAVTIDELEPHQDYGYSDKEGFKTGVSFPWPSKSERKFPAYKARFGIKNALLITILLLSIGAVAFMIYMAIDAFNRQGDTYRVAREAFNVINEYRQTNGIAPLIWDEGIEQLALEHSKYMNDTNDFTTGDFGLGNYGQNILQSSGAMFGGGAFPSGNSIVSEWKDDSGDYNLLNSMWKYGAIGVVGDYATYIASAQSSNSQ